MISAKQKPIQSGFHSKSNADEIIKEIDLSEKIAIVTGGYSLSLIHISEPTRPY